MGCIYSRRLKGLSKVWHAVAYAEFPLNILFLCEGQAVTLHYSLQDHDPSTYFIFLTLSLTQMDRAAVPSLLTSQSHAAHRLSSKVSWLLA